MLTNRFISSLWIPFDSRMFPMDLDDSGWLSRSALVWEKTWWMIAKIFGQNQSGDFLAAKRLEVDLEFHQRFWLDSKSLNEKNKKNLRFSKHLQLYFQTASGRYKETMDLPSFNHGRFSILWWLKGSSLSGEPLSKWLSAVKVSSSQWAIWSSYPFLGDTVDGRNPAPVDRWFIPLFTGFHTPQVVQDFSHQQYHIYRKHPKNILYQVILGVLWPFCSPCVIQLASEDKLSISISRVGHYMREGYGTVVVSCISHIIFDCKDQTSTSALYIRYMHAPSSALDI